MSIRQIRARFDALKRKYALHLLILLRRRRAEKLCHLWDIADLNEINNHQPFPNTVMMIPDFVQEAPHLPTFRNYMRLNRYLIKTRRVKIHPTPYGIVQSLLPKAHKTGLLAHVMKLHFPVR